MGAIKLETRTLGTVAAAHERHVCYAKVYIRATPINYYEII